MDEETGILARWLLHHSVMNFHVGHRAGKNQQAPDALSPLEITRDDTSPLDDDLPLMSMIAPPDESNEDDTCYADHSPLNQRGMTA